MTNLNQATNEIQAESVSDLKKLNKKQGGFTIVELLIGIGVIVGFLALVYGIYSRISTSNNANAMVAQLTTFQTKIKEVYVNQPNGYSGISDTELITSKAYPGDLNSTGTQLTSSFAGKVNVAASASDNTEFTITYEKVPSGVCIAVVNKLASAGSWNSIAITGKSIWSGTASVPTKSAIDTACNATATVSMAFASN